MQTAVENTARAGGRSVAQRLRMATLPLKTRLLASACAGLERPAGGPVPGRAALVRLALAWGNLGYAAGFSYLRHVSDRVLNGSGPVLECGSGATTLLIAALTRYRDLRFVALEHDPHWHDYLQRVLDGLGYRHVELVHAPLRQRGPFAWYDVAPGAVPDDIGLVICDGPPGSVRGGRYGLMPVMGERLASNCIVLLDDTHRAAEQRIIEVWRRQRCLSASRLGPFGTYTELALC